MIDILPRDPKAILAGQGAALHQEGGRTRAGAGDAGQPSLPLRTRDSRQLPSLCRRKSGNLAVVQKWRPQTAEPRVLRLTGHSGKYLLLKVILTFGGVVILVSRDPRRRRTDRHAFQDVPPNSASVISAAPTFSADPSRPEIDPWKAPLAEAGHQRDNGELLLHRKPAGGLFQAEGRRLTTQVWVAHNHATSFCCSGGERASPRIWNCTCYSQPL